MICTSTLANCLRMANINSCLRIVDAFSTSFSSANAKSSVGDFCFKTFSFISRIGGTFSSDFRLEEPQVINLVEKALRAEGSTGRFKPLRPAGSGDPIPRDTHVDG